ncbi:unnamed protein product, partial [marine sediment metagenome]
WRKEKNMVDRWDSPRGFTIDSEDNVFQSGNAGGDAGCGVRKIAKDGTILAEKILVDYDETVYCWGSVADQFGDLIISGDYNWDEDNPGTYLMKYNGDNLTKINIVDFIVSPRMIAGQRATAATIDQFANP